MREWNASQLMRGPAAMTNGILLPFRGLAGGFRGGFVGIALSPLAAAAGAVEGATWILGGSVDLVTAGALALTPDGLARIRIQPLLLLPIAERSYEEYRNHPDCPG